MKQTHLRLVKQLSGELLLPFVLTACNETSAPPHPLRSIQMRDNIHLNSLVTSPARSSHLGFLIACRPSLIRFQFNAAEASLICSVGPEE